MEVTNREYKSDVFSMLMEYPEYALDVYKALGGTSESDSSKLEIKTLEKCISLSVRNDAAFIIDTDLHLYEHQSTYNPNMPLRALLYLSDIIKPMVKDKGLYGKKLIQIPKPKFVVFYNGEVDRPEKEMQKLSSAYAHTGDASDSIELTCTVYNINPNRNNEIKENSYVLNGYMQFVEKVREYVRDEYISDEAAVEKAVDYCIDNHVLEDFFRKRKSEVVKVMTIDMTFEAREKIAREEEYNDGFSDGFNDGKAEGKEEGKEEGRILQLIELVRDGLLKITDAADKAGMTTEEFELLLK